MAERRMLSSKIVCSDAFIEMPHSAQSLYVQLNMDADDDGFLNSPVRVMRTICATQDDLDILLAKRFVLRFPNGVIAIKHWRIHNQIRKDRYTATQYQNEFNSLVVRDDGAYTEREKDDAPQPLGNHLATAWQPSGNQTATKRQPRLGEVRLGKVNNIYDADESSDSPPPPKKPVKHKYGEYKNVLLTDEELAKLQADFPDWEERIERLSSYVASTGKRYKSHYATVRNWAKKDADQQNARQPSRGRTGRTIDDMGYNDPRNAELSL